MRRSIVEPRERGSKYRSGGEARPCRPRRVCASREAEISCRSALRARRPTRASYRAHHQSKIYHQHVTSRRNRKITATYRGRAVATKVKPINHAKAYRRRRNFLLACVAKMTNDGERHFGARKWRLNNIFCLPRIYMAKIWYWLFHRPSTFSMPCRMCAALIVIGARRSRNSKVMCIVCPCRPTVYLYAIISISIFVPYR